MKLFVEIFACTAGLSGAVKVSGCIIYTFDCKNGKKRNILMTDTFKLIKKPIRSGNCIGVWFGMPCGTFSSARNAKDGGPGPMRDHNDVMEPRSKAAEKIESECSSQTKSCTE